MGFETDRHLRCKFVQTEIMAVSATDKELLKYFTLLNEYQKKSLLQLIRTFLEPEGLNYVITLEQYNKELEEALEQSNKGEFTTLEELEKEMQSW